MLPSQLSEAPAPHQSECSLHAIVMPTQWQHTAGFSARPGPGQRHESPTSKYQQIPSMSRGRTRRILRCLQTPPKMITSVSNTSLFRGKQEKGLWNQAPGVSALTFPLPMTLPAMFLKIKVLIRSYTERKAGKQQHVWASSSAHHGFHLPTPSSVQSLLF